MTYTLALDVGGTQIKGGVLTDAGQVLDGCTQSFPSRSDADRERILAHFTDIIGALARSIPDGEKRIGGLALAFPGDFDYTRGICLMRGVAKYDGIYKVDLRAEFSRRIASSDMSAWLAPGFRIGFVNDIEAFALGAYHDGAAPRCEKLLALCIGTGAGSAFLYQGRPAPGTMPGVPPRGWIYDTPYRESIIDDYLSRRGLMKLSVQLLGETLDGRALAERALRGDGRAMEVYRRFGDHIAAAMEPFIQAFLPDRMILGGQITKSHALFDGPLRHVCAQHGVDVDITADTSRAAFRGLYYALAQP